MERSVRREWVGGREQGVVWGYYERGKGLIRGGGVFVGELREGTRKNEGSKMLARVLPYEERV